MVLTAYSALSLVIGLCVTIAGAMRSIVAHLISASRYQDHTTSPSAKIPRTPCEGIGVHRSLPRVRGDREPPLLVGQGGAKA